MAGTTVKIFLVVLFVSFSACISEMDESNTQYVDLLTAFDFENGSQNWIGGVSDFPIDFQDSAMFFVSNDIIANSLSSDSKGLNVSAENPHGELFYFFIRKMSGLEPGIRYRIDVEFLVYTQLEKPEDGELFLKVGATNFEPELISTSEKSADILGLNIDKGESNSQSGVDLVNIGSIKEFTGETPELISGNTFDFNIEVVPDKNGEVWLIIGVDSGVKSNLTFGMKALTVYFRKQI